MLDRTHEQKRPGLSPTCFSPFFRMTYHFLRYPLRFFRFMPGRADALVFYEGGYEVAEEGAAVRGVAGEVAVFY